MMECIHARVLLYFVRPGATELEAGDLEALQNHLSDCADCGALARSERGFDQAVGRAMVAVPVPLNLRQRLLERLHKENPQRRRRRLMTGLAAAAALLLAAGLSWQLWLRPLPVVEVDQILINVDPNPEAVEEMFREEGVTMVAPRRVPDGREFNYTLLKGRHLGIHQGKPVPRLLFVARTEGGHVVTAEFLVLSDKQFDIKALPGGSSGTEHNITFVGPESGFLFLVIYTGGSLNPFLKPQTVL